MRRIICLASLFLLSACVLSPIPVGEHPLPLDPAEWNGHWRAEQEKRTYLVQVSTAFPGRLHAKVVRDEISPAKKHEDMDIFLMSGGGGLFASLTTPDGFVWFRLEREGGDITVRAPDADSFRSMVEKGDLPSRVMGENVMVERMGPDFLRFLSSPEGLSCFEPEVLELKREK